MRLLFLLLIVTLLQASVHCLVCYQCGVPGTISCEQAFRFGLTVAEQCSSKSCVATSYTLSHGKRSMLKSCNTKGKYMCSVNQSREMSYDTCQTCTTDFCNGPLPTCTQQLKFISKCIHSHKTLNLVLIWSTVIIVIVLLCFSVRKYRKEKREQREHNEPLVAKFSTNKNFSLPNSSGGDYTRV